MYMRLQALMNSIMNWSDKQFDNGNFTPKRTIPMAKHLKEESQELVNALNIYFGKNKPKRMDEQFAYDVREEIADCMILLLDICSHLNITSNQLISLAESKLEINKDRYWGKPVDGVVNHIKNHEYEPFFGWCEVEGCENEACSGGVAWKDTGYWFVCHKHMAQWRNGEKQPKMEEFAIKRENSRDSETGYLKYNTK